jgi:hypothetical protein
MLESIGNFLSSIAIYIAALSGLVAAYFLWVAFREWRSGSRAYFGVERDIAQSEMIGAILRAGAFVIFAALVLGLGWLGGQAESPTGEAADGSQPTATALPGTPATPDASQPTPATLPTDTPDVAESTATPAPEPTDSPAPTEPAPQTAIVRAFGGVWLRDAPNGGTIGVLPEESLVQVLEEREQAGNFEWQKIRVISAPPGGEALVGQEGWVALEFLETP